MDDKPTKEQVKKEAAELKARGFTPLSGPYSSNQLFMLNNAVSELVRAGVNYAIHRVLIEGGVWKEVWRDRKGFRK